MNCESFQEIIYEYVDDALSPPEKTAAQAHLGECSACRDLVQDEWLIAQVLSGHLSEAVEPVALNAHKQRSMADAVRKQVQNTPQSKKPLLLPFWIRLAIPAAAACLVLTLGFWLGRGFIRPRDPSVAATPTSPGPVGVEIPIHISYSAPRYTFHREGTMVIDALITDTPVADGALLAVLAEK
jgi:anti-sigma factor RsiW